MDGASARLAELGNWLEVQLGEAPSEILPASEDASFRRYFRVPYGDGSAIVMDAPPPQEDCSPFVRVAALFAAAGMHVPQILAQDLTRGFMLLTDLGATTYLDALAAGADAEGLYRDALAALVRLQSASRPAVLPAYDRSLLARELALFPDWYVARHLGIALSAQQTAAFAEVCDRVLACNLREPQVYVHRDYHSRNLMLAEPNPGVLDFQDAVYGPLSYDLASLLKDAYVEWPEERVLDWAVRYWEHARRAGVPVCRDFGDFYRDFEWMGVQRHLKVLGIFARLWHRDGKDRYLADMPLVLRYLERAAARYAELEPLARLLDQLHGRAPRAVQSF